MASLPVPAPKPTCHYKKSNGEFCKRTVVVGEGMCWQHAKSWGHKLKSLTRNQALGLVATIILGVLTVALTAAGVYLQYDSWQATRNAPRYRVPPPPASSRFTDKPSTDYSVIVGSNMLQISPNGWVKDGEPMVLIGDEGHRIVAEAYVKDGKIVVNAHLFAGGDQRVNIVANEIENNMSGWDRNYDDSAVEIVDATGNPMLQIIYKSPYLAELYGVFQRTNGQLVVITRDTLSQATTPTNVKGYPLKPLFHYPSRLHQGEELGPDF